LYNNEYSAFFKVVVVYTYRYQQIYDLQRSRNRVSWLIVRVDEPNQRQSLQQYQYGSIENMLVYLHIS
jgi:hypothetical protein